MLARIWTLMRRRRLARQQERLMPALGMGAPIVAFPPAGAIGISLDRDRFGGALRGLPRVTAARWRAR